MGPTAFHEILVILLNLIFQDFDVTLSIKSTAREEAGKMSPLEEDNRKRRAEIAANAAEK